LGNASTLHLKVLFKVHLGCKGINLMLLDDSDMLMLKT
jgi:hypothetical protein